MRRRHDVRITLNRKAAVVPYTTTCFRNEKFPGRGKIPDARALRLIDAYHEIHCSIRWRMRIRFSN